VPKLPFVIVRTMSKIFRTAIMIVVATTMRVPRIIGMVTLLKSFQPTAPSSSAASTTSIEIALMAADRTTMANPTWIQIMMTIRKKLLRGCQRIQLGGSCTPSHMTTWLSSPTWGCDGSRYS